MEILSIIKYKWQLLEIYIYLVYFKIKNEKTVFKFLQYYKNQNNK